MRRRSHQWEWLGSVDRGFGNTRARTQPDLGIGEWCAVASPAVQDRTAEHSVETRDKTPRWSKVCFSADGYLRSPLLTGMRSIASYLAARRFSASSCIIIMFPVFWGFLVSVFIVFSWKQAVRS